MDIFFLFCSSGKIEMSEQICSNGIDVVAHFQSSFLLIILEDMRKWFRQRGNSFGQGPPSGRRVVEMLYTILLQVAWSLWWEALCCHQLKTAQD